MWSSLHIRYKSPSLSTYHYYLHSTDHSTGFGYFLHLDSAMTHRWCDIDPEPESPLQTCNVGFYIVKDLAPIICSLALNKLLRYADERERDKVNQHLGYLKSSAVASRHITPGYRNSGFIQACAGAIVAFVNVATRMSFCCIRTVTCILDDTNEAIWLRRSNARSCICWADTISANTEMNS